MNKVFRYITIALLRVYKFATMSNTLYTSLSQNPILGSPNSLVQDILDQRRQRFLFNIPQPRLTPVSPYDSYTKAQIDMRRKIEILKYKTNPGLSKLSGQTSSQRWSSLSNIIAPSRLSQLAISSSINSGTTYSPDDIIPKLTSASNVPGPLSVLQYDPLIPLLDSQTTTNRTFATEIQSDLSVWHVFTKNEVDFLIKPSYCVIPDSNVNDHEDNHMAGVILITSNITTSTLIFNISIPIAMYFIGVAQSSVNSEGNYNIELVNIYKSLNPVLNLHISSIVPEVYFNKSLVTPVSEPTVEIDVVDMSFNLVNTDRQFYGIQYVGMVHISGLELKTNPGDIYNINLKVNYSYNRIVASYLQTIKTGFYPNISVLNQKFAVNCVINTSTPSNYSPGSFEAYPQPREYVHFPLLGTYSTI